MSATATSLPSLCLLALAAFASLYLATQRRNLRLVRDIDLPRWHTPLRCLGWGLLATAAVTAVITGGWGPGLVALCGALTLAAFVVIGLASYRPEGLLFVLAMGCTGGFWALGKIVVSGIGAG
ncbi:DUF3325 domain-containing protein [Microbulbifer taiwanensis]|uniref:DUF3325 domain-containing protein n=1 Tax=Microbulbifer taiwanensis TaxID=986746 RepID=A0ABW1YJ05_9GAMM|nr:DUF3325 domain-containing protein [Microbulbifer taiwanensis]